MLWPWEMDSRLAISPVPMGSLVLQSGALHHLQLGLQLQITRGITHIKPTHWMCLMLKLGLVRSGLMGLPRQQIICNPYFEQFPSSEHIHRKAIF